MASKHIGLSIIVVALLLLIGGLVVWNRSHEQHPDDYDDLDETRQSNSLERDIRLMWETQRLRGEVEGAGTSTPHSSTDAAIRAASRVFNTVKLVGLTRKEVIATIGDPKTSNNSIYNFPFHPVPKGTMVYRFDNGAYGWQFNLFFDAKGKVQRVDRQGIQ